MTWRALSISPCTMVPHTLVLQMWAGNLMEAGSVERLFSTTPCHELVLEVPQHQGLTLVHLSAQRTCTCLWITLGGVSLLVTKTAEVELKSRRA
jgi:hypothetical protein